MPHAATHATRERVIQPFHPVPGRRILDRLELFNNSITTSTLATLAQHTHQRTHQLTQTPATALSVLSSHSILYLEDGYWTDWSDCESNGIAVTCGVNNSVTTRNKICPRKGNSTTIHNVTCSTFEASCGQMPCFGWSRLRL